MKDADLIGVRDRNASEMLSTKSDTDLLWRWTSQEGCERRSLIGVSDLSHNITTSDMFCSTVYRYPTAMATPSVLREYTICSLVPSFPGIPAF